MSTEIAVEDADLVRFRLERDEVLSPGAFVRMAIDDDGRVGESERPVEVEEPRPQSQSLVFRHSYEITRAPYQ